MVRILLGIYFVLLAAIGLFGVHIDVKWLYLLEGVVGLTLLLQPYASPYLRRPTGSV